MTKRQLGVRVDGKLYKALKVLAVQRDTSVQALLEESMRMMLRRFRVAVPR
jgi:hypothetical protein